MYRDDLEAAHARIAALEAQVGQLEGRATPARPHARARRIVLAAGIGGVAATGVLLALSLYLPAMTVATLAISLLGMWVALGCLVQAGPDEALVIGTTQGIRIVAAGQIRLVPPIVGHLHGRVSLRPRLVVVSLPELEVSAHYRTEMQVQAVERYAAGFLGQPPEAIDSLVADVIGAAARRLLGEIRVEELRHDPERAVAKIIQLAEEKLDRHGLSLQDLTVTPR